MKRLQELTGVKTLSKKQQQAVKGGIRILDPCEGGGIIIPGGERCDIWFEGACWICR